MALDKTVPGGLYKNAKGQWVNANGEPVDINKLPASVRQALGIKPPQAKVITTTKSKGRPPKKGT